FAQKQATAKAEQDKKDAIAMQDKNKQKVIRNSFIAGFALMLALAFFIFRGYRQKQKANEIITQQKEEVEKQKTLVEHQKALVEEKNRDILDSITYAKRLQDAILPPLSIINQYLPQSFVLYKPKDIVAGDFYWLERTADTILIAAADCTGHGVPGALVSVVCSNALNRTVKEFGITEPGKILDKVRELVLETFEKSEDNVQDGMDISLCCLNTQTLEIQWSGANNSLWYIQNKELKEVEPNKQPIGKYYNATAFNTHKLNLQKGDALYLFTDGYADQFGGEKGKKFKYKQMQQLIVNNTQLTMAQQKELLNKEFEGWKGNLEQVDDVLVIGIRI
ncbi:MAG TPA: SpoIIE family protein phosphatase, partial [Bacteroidia bacterium]|nr:SpoIIE family protein phosphatase [Bacteroidia bacterium]